MNADKMRAEYKRRRTVAIKKLREAGMTENEIQQALAGIRDELGIDSTSNDSVDNLPALIDSAEEARSTQDKKRPWPKKPNRDENYRSTDKDKVAQYDSMLAANPERRCNGTNTLGERCRNFAIKGGTVCKYHGGATKHVKDKARVRIEMASNRLIGKLIEFAFDDTKPAKVQLDAIKDSLNRAGMKPPEKVEVGPIRAYETVFDDIYSGSRDDYRAGINDSESTDYGDYSPTESTDQFTYFEEQQSNSPNTAPADEGYSRERPEPRGPDDPGHCTRPAAPQRREDRPADRYSERAHIIGDEALRVANAANARIGALRALPAGPSAWE